VAIAFIIVQSTPAFKSRFYHHIFIDQNTNKLIFIGKNIKDLAKTNQYINHYLTAIEIFKDNKIFGAGLKNFRYVSHKKKYNLVEGARRGGSTHPHQIHFEILSETGLVGYILLFGMLIYFMVKGLNSFVKSKNILNLSAFIFVLATLLPLIPSGSFFTSYTATLFWINFSFLLKKNF
jgi:O-antigen ligase